MVNATLNETLLSTQTYIGKITVNLPFIDFTFQKKRLQVSLKDCKAH